MLGSKATQPGDKESEANPIRCAPEQAERDRSTPLVFLGLFFSGLEHEDLQLSSEKRCDCLIAQF